MGPIPSSRDYEAWHAALRDYFPFPSRPSRWERGRPRGLTKSCAGVGHWAPGLGARWHGEKRGLARREGKVGQREEEMGEGKADPQACVACAPEDARPKLRVRGERSPERRSLPASEQSRRGHGHSELLAAAAARRLSPRLATAPASLCPASPRHLPNLCPTMARPYQPLPRNHFRGEGGVWGTKIFKQAIELQVQPRAPPRPAEPKLHAPEGCAGAAGFSRPREPGRGAGARQRLDLHPVCG